MDSDVIFQRVAVMTGLSSFLAPGTIRRALSDVGARPESASLSAWRSALVRIESRMRAYLPEQEVEVRVRAISVFLERQGAALVHAGGGASQVKGERGERDDKRIR